MPLYGRTAQRSNRRQKYINSASRKCTAQFQGLTIISCYKVTYCGPKMTGKNIESSSCSKKGCLQSIERLKAQPASRQWDLTSGGHLEAAKSCTTQTFCIQCFYEHFGDVLFMCKHSFKQGGGGGTTSHTFS